MYYFKKNIFSQPNYMNIGVSLFRAAVWGVDEGQLALKLALLQLQLLSGLKAVCGIAFRP